MMLGGEFQLFELSLFQKTFSVLSLLDRQAIPEVREPCSRGHERNVQCREGSGKIKDGGVGRPAAIPHT